MPHGAPSLGALAVLLCCAAADAAAAPSAAAVGAVEEMVVIGSRIRRDALEAQDLILGLDVADDGIARKSLGAMLATLPVSGSPLSTRFNSSGNFGFPADGGGVAAGAAQVDLRHLGAKRVLVLVDGLRWIHGSSGSGVSGATDLNTLPAGVVKRVEVSLDGASSIYGSDAIAGVVNLVTAGVQGVRASVHGGGYANGGTARGFELALGGERGRASASLHLSHVDQGAIRAADHAQTRDPLPGAGTRHGSTFTPQGRVIFTDPNTGNFVNCALDSGVAGLPVYDPAAPCGADDDYHPWSNADRFNYAPYNLTLTPSTRSAAFARLEFALAETLDGHLRLLGSNRRSVNQAAPEPLWAGPLAASGSLLDEIVIAADNPYNPFGFDLAAGAWATRRPLESGPRVFKQDVDTRYGATGLRGVWSPGRRALFWDLNLVVARNVAHQAKHGAHNARKMLVALGAPDACAATPGCVPLNLLGGQGDGGGTITPAMLDWIGFVQRDFSDQTLRDWTFNIAGDLAALPAGDAAFAAGFEHRVQRGRFRPDPVVAAGDTAGQPAQPTAGEQAASEWYGEVEVPLVAGARGADLLAVSGAMRHFEYDSFGSGNAGRLALDWRPLASLLLRANWAEGFRAPNIGELHGGETRLDAVLKDPCSDFAASGIAQAVVASCIAAGVPADGSYAQLGGQIALVTGGNDALLPETSRSRTFALTWRPPWAARARWAEELRFELDHYSHDVEGAITGLDPQAVLDGCHRDRVESFCGFVTRNASGHIRRFRNTLLNVGGIETSGWDFAAAYASPTTIAGRLEATWRATHLADYVERVRNASGAVVETRRLHGRTQADRGKPRWKSSLRLDWRRGPWQAAWTFRYIHSMTERCSNFLDGSPDSLTNLGLCSMPNHDDNSESRNRLSSILYHDARVGYEAGGLEGPEGPVGKGGWTATLGVNNLFNRDPPISRSATLNGYDASTYDIPGGRFAYLEIAYARP